MSKYFGISNMFLPIFAAEVGHELNLPVEPIHLLLYAAEAASRLPAVEKKVRVHVVFNYHNIRLERSWNWIKICYGINPG